MRRTWLIAGAAVAAVLLVIAAWLFQPWLLWVDREVDEELPPAVGEYVAPEGQPPPTEGSPGPVDVARGSFIDAEHATRGKVRIIAYPDGRRFLRLEGLDTSNGPDLHVWLTDRPSGGACAGCRDSWGIYDDGAYVGLGALKGNQGDQNYEIPEDADLASLRSVVIWCDRFNVAFGTAAID